MKEKKNKSIFRTSKKTLAVIICVLTVCTGYFQAMFINGGIDVYADGLDDLEDINFDESKQRIYDDADLYTESQEEKLQKKLTETSKVAKLDLVIVTIDRNPKSDSILYADDFYDDNHFGYDYDTGSGVLMLIDMDNREVAISTSGVCRVYLDMVEEDIREEMVPYLTDGEYMQAAEIFISRVKQEAQTAQENDDYDEAFDDWYSSDYSDIIDQNIFYDKYIKKDNFFTNFKNPLIDMAIALIVAGIAVLIMRTTSETKTTVNERTYMENGHLNLRVRSDQFTHTTTTRRRIETDNVSRGGISGGGGGGHVSSSGHSHGGGSSKF